MELTPNGKSVAFKTKKKSSTNTKGAVCKQSPKQDILDNIVSISGSKKLMLNHMGREKLCVYLELVLRYYNDIKHDNKIWFLHYKT